MIGQDGWRARANCVGVAVEAFFPEPGSGGNEDVRALCRGCEVRLECLGHALDFPEPHGIWGGLSPNERHRLRRKQNTLAS